MRQSVTRSKIISPFDEQNKIYYSCQQWQEDALQLRNYFISHQSLHPEQQTQTMTKGATHQRLQYEEDHRATCATMPARCHQCAAESLDRHCDSGCPALRGMPQQQFQGFNNAARAVEKKISGSAEDHPLGHSARKSFDYTDEVPARDQCATWVQERLLSYSHDEDARPEIPARVHARVLDPDRPSKSLPVDLTIQARGASGRFLVITLRSQVLATFQLSALRISRVWNVKSSTERIVALTVPDCGPDEGDAVHLRLDCYESLDQLSRMTGFHLE